MNIYDFDNYRVYLKAELADRIDRNPTYSLRAMARNLGVASSTLSEVINGRANLSVMSARKIAVALKLKSKETSYLCDLVQLDAQTDAELKEQYLEKLRRAHPRKRSMTDLSIEQFKQMSEWYHLAILELALLKDFEFKSENIAKAIGISKPTAELAIDRLVKLGLLENISETQMRRLHPDFRVRSELKNSAMRKYYRQMLEKITSSLEEQSPQERLSGYLNMPLDEAALPEINEAIANFFDELKSISSKHKNKTKVYHLSLHFINLIKKEISNEK